MIEADYGEILRYLGYKSGQMPGSDVEQRIHDCASRLCEAIEPRSVYRKFPLIHQGGGGLDIDGLNIQSLKLARNLKGCEAVYLMAATLGVGADRQIARASALRMSDAVIYQAAAAAYIEAYCDGINDDIRREAEEEGLYCRPRFSPGYGDFPVEHQRDFVRLLDTHRKIGLSVTESCLLVPVKSVTAVIGVSREQQPCHSKGCEECGKTDCAFRR